MLINHFLAPVQHIQNATKYVKLQACLLNKMLYKSLVANFHRMIQHKVRGTFLSRLWIRHSNKENSKHATCLPNSGANLKSQFEKVFAVHWIQISFLIIYSHLYFLWISYINRHKWILETGNSAYNCQSQPNVKHSELTCKFHLIENHLTGLKIKSYRS